VPEHLPTQHREPPERIERTTRSGADQYVLACNARRSADADTFHQILQLEQENSELRREVAWKKQHASSLTAKWLGGWTVVSLYVIAAASALGFWLLSPDGRVFRVAAGVGYSDTRPLSDARIERGFFTRDMSQHEIDSIAASVRGAEAQRAVRD